MKMFGKTSLGKMVMLMNVIMVKREKISTGISAQWSVKRDRGRSTKRNTEPNSGRNGENIQCGREDTGDVGKTTLNTGGHDKMWLQMTSPVSDPEKQDGHPSNTEPNTGRIGENVQNGDSLNTAQSSDRSAATGAVKKPFICDFCGKCFNWRCMLKAHLNSHIKPFSCPQCGKGFSTKTGCSNHLLVVHSKEKTFKCADCGKMFALRSSLVKHRELNPTRHTCTTHGINGIFIKQSTPRRSIAVKPLASFSFHLHPDPVIRVQLIQQGLIAV
ncbi:unnamed protein product, partial [Coregonus sp. 'balchen']